MKSLIAAFVVLCAQAVQVARASQASVAWMHVPTRQVRWFRPPSLRVGETTYSSPTDGQLAQAGYVETEWDDAYGDMRYRVISWDPPSIRAFTPEEKASADLSDAEASEQDAYEASLPIQEPRGFEVPYVVFLDATNRQKGIAMELTTNNVPIYYEFHASPVDWKKVDANRKAALAAAKAERTASAANEKANAEAVAYAKEKAAKDDAAKAEAVAAINEKEPSKDEKIDLMWKAHLANLGLYKSETK